MLEYVNLNDSRMKFLCDYLGDTSHNSYKNCDNTDLPKYQIKIKEDTKQNLVEFHETYFPVLNVAPKSTIKMKENKYFVYLNDENQFQFGIEGKSLETFESIELLKASLAISFSDQEVSKVVGFIEKHRNTKSRIVNGVASSFYGVSSVGAALHRCKYENGGDFPDFLLRLTLKAFRKRYGQEAFDFLVYVPPTESGDLVKNFAEKLARILKIPISHKLIKTSETQAQKIFKNNYLKRSNVSHKFSYSEPNELVGKSIILFDDIFDSGASIKEIGQVLTRFGAKKIAPLVIARTVGGDI